MTYLDWIRELASRRTDAPRCGTLDRIDPAARLRGVAEVRRGRVLSIGARLRPGVNVRGDDLPAFALRTFYRTEPTGVFTDPAVGTGSDHLELDAHGIDNTHIDALNHTAVDGTWYGGVPVGDPAASLADFAAEGVVTRALYLDIPALRGVDHVAIDEPVSGDELAAAVAATGRTLEPGDAVLVDLGRDRYVAAGGALRSPERPGIGESGARWIAEQQLSAVAWDLLDAKHPAEPPAAVHLLNWAIGLVLVDNCDFAAARDLLRTAGAGLLVVAPLPIDGATGGNVNPLVVV